MGQEVRVIRQREDGSYYRACPKCDQELDLEAGEWVGDFPDRDIHGYRISQLFSSKVDAGEILHEYRRTRFPERFYNLKIGLAWADTRNRLTESEVFRCCGEEGMLERSLEECTMGVDTGRELHVVISRRLNDNDEDDRRRVVYLGTHHSYEELDVLLDRFNVWRCVIDALPEIHATRALARRHPGEVYLNYFNEHQKGSPSWNHDDWIVQENRTEALDLSRARLRDRKVILPRRSPPVEGFARHVAADAKLLEEDQDTGAKSYRYVRTGPDHLSLAFTYDCIAAQFEETHLTTGVPVFGY